MDLITSLPKTKRGYTAIVVFVDRLTKMVHIVPTVNEVNAPQLAQVFFHSVFKLHGLPKAIISDRDTRFTSAFWGALWTLLGTKLSMSTAFHPQTDGQTERMNCTLEDMLRAYVGPLHNDWDLHLTAAEFAYNNSKQASTGFSPFFLNYGFHPRTPADVATGAERVQAAADWLDAFQRDLADAKTSLGKAQQRQAEYADRSRRDEQFKVGDKVMLNTSNIDQRGAGRSRKLQPKWIGPFTIQKCISPVACRLDLPGSFKLHPVFHTSMLKPHFDGKQQFPERDATAEPPPLWHEGVHPVYEIESVIGKKAARSAPIAGAAAGPLYDYLVKWRGHPDSEAKWFPATELTHIQDLIDAFEQQQQADAPQPQDTAAANS